MWKWAICMMAVGLTTCSRPPPYAGLERNSYGQLSNRPLRYCNSQVQGLPPGSGIDQLAKGITAAIASPFGGSIKPDETILKEDLQTSFKIPADVSRPNVVLLSRDEKHILFWYILDLVTQDEVADAAKLYCKREKRVAIPEGSAQRCDEIKLAPFAVNGQQVQQHSTFVISNFRCDISTRTSPMKN